MAEEKKFARSLEDLKALAPERSLFLVGSLLKTCMKLDDESKKQCFKDLGTTCHESGWEDRRKMGLYPEAGSLDIDEAIDLLMRAAPFKRDIKRDGDTITWESHLKAWHGQCLCPLVLRGAVPLTIELCWCGAQHLRALMETLTTSKFKDPEVLHSMATGNETCKFRFQLEP